MLAAVTLLAACPGRHGRPAEGRVADTSFAAMQARGQMVMGVDQYTSMHVFEDLPDGGRIVLERKDAADSTGRYVLCGVPATTRLTLQADAGRERSRAVALRFGGGGAWIEERQFRSLAGPIWMEDLALAP